RSVYHRVRHNLRQTSAKVRRLEHILKNPADVFPGALVRIKPQSAMAKVQWTYIVETKNMIGVTMGDQDGIEMFQAGPQSLLAKIAGSIDDNCLAGVFDQDRDA